MFVTSVLKSFIFIVFIWTIANVLYFITVFNWKKEVSIFGLKVWLICYLSIIIMCEKQNAVEEIVK